LVDLRLFRSFGFSMGNLAGLMGYAMLFGVFFLVPFILIRAYGETALEAGLRLSIVPVVLSLVAPFSGTLSDRLGPRLLTVAGMAICADALVALALVVDGKASSLFVVMVALGAIGLGQGLFTSPNNNSIMDAAPERLTGEAGGLMNVTRSIGTSLGVAAAATYLSWQLEVVGGNGAGRTTGIAAGKLAEAGDDVLLLLAGFAAMAAIISLVRPQSRSSPGTRPAVALE
jgi:MFS family permease